MELLLFLGLLVPLFCCSPLGKKLCSLSMRMGASLIGLSIGANFGMGLGVNLLNALVISLLGPCGVALLLLLQIL
ncbi:MAG: transcriptional regulator [Eubacteriales bacterium]